MIRPDPLVQQQLAVTDTAIVAGTPVSLTGTGVTPSTMLAPGVVGLAITNVNVGDLVAYITRGFLELSDWTAIIGSPTLTPGTLYFLGITQFLTNIAPSTGYIVVIGSALTSTRLDISINQRIGL